MSFHPRLEKITKELLQQPARSVTIALGELFPLNEQEVRAQWSGLVTDTSLAQTRLSVHLIKAYQQCMTCFEKYHPLNGSTVCPNCGGMGAKILAGEEFHVEEVRLEDE